MFDARPTPSNKPPRPPRSDRFATLWRVRSLLDRRERLTPADHQTHRRYLFKVPTDCAGAIADLYAEQGGEVFYAGKPYRPLYDLALAEVARARGKPVPLDRVLAIGDSVRTDLKGAHDLGIDCLFVTAGIHAEELGRRDDPDPAALRTMFAAAGQMPKAVTRRLVW